MSFGWERSGLKLPHIGCGSKRKDQTLPAFQSDDWQELSFDINESVAPDIIGTITDMSAVETGSMDARFSSHIGFTHKVLAGTLRAAGFGSVATIRRPEKFDLWAFAMKRAVSDVELKERARRYLNAVAA